MTTLDLSDQEAEQFKAFRKHQDNFNVLLEAGFFDIKGASGTVHFDDRGSIRKIESMTVRLYTVRPIA